MSQSQLITLLTIILLLVVFGSIVVLLNTSDDATTSLPTTTDETTTQRQRLFSLDILERQAYQLLNKQLVKEGALPVRPPSGVGKANPFI